MLVPENTNGKVYLVGIGPGQPELLTPQARETIERVGIVIGQPDTLDGIKDLIRAKEVISFGSNPVERSRIAVEKAQAGREVAIVSSGDPGVYAVAATFFAFLRDNDISLDIEVVPGLGLAGYAAARLGAPLGGDHASISLSDRGTPWTDIKKRIEAAASADFVVVIYNPIGKLGPGRLQEALETFIRYRGAATPVGILSQGATLAEKSEVTTLGAVDAISLPLDTLLIIGGSQTYVRSGRMITPRTYTPGIGY